MNIVLDYYDGQGGRRVMIRISGSLIWSKTLMDLIFSPCGEFRWSPEGPVSQNHSPHLHVAAPGIFSDLLRSVQMIKMWKSTGSYRTYSIPGKTVALIPQFVVEDLPSAELQPRFLRLQWKTWPWAEHTDNNDDDDGQVIPRDDCGPNFLVFVLRLRGKPRKKSQPGNWTEWRSNPGPLSEK